MQQQSLFAHAPRRVRTSAPQAPKFNGPEYDAKRDDARLTGQLKRVFEAMRDGHWRTITELARLTGDPENSAAAQLRHLRKPRFGGHTVNRRSRSGALFEYQLIVNAKGGVMSRKHGKQYRRAARNAAGAGAPKVAYVRHSETGQIRAHPRSVRGVYLAMKRRAAAAP